MEIRRILLDMDCVLADFMSGVARAFGFTPAQLLAAAVPGEYDVQVPLGKLLNWDRRGGRLPDDVFWGRVERDLRWAELDPLPWARDLVRLVDSLTPEWYVVTSPARGRECVPGKQEWWNRFRGRDWCDRLIPTRHKHLLAKPGAVLIDDHEANVERFEAEGGTGILFPCHHNRLHEQKSHPIPYVRRMLCT